MYLIPKNLNSKIKISKHLHLKEFVLFLVGMGIAFLFDSVIAPSVKIVYYIFSFLTIGFLLLPARHNPEKDNYEAIYYALIRNNNGFHAISIEETKMGQEENSMVTNDITEELENNILAYSQVKEIEKDNIPNEDKEVKENRISLPKPKAFSRVLKYVGKVKEEQKQKAAIKEDEEENKKTIILEEPIPEDKKEIVSDNTAPIPIQIELMVGSIAVFNDKRMYYIKNIDDLKKIETYRILNSDLNVLLIKNAINLKKEYAEFLDDDSVLNLDKNYTFKLDNVIEVKGLIPNEVIDHVNGSIDFLKERGYLKNIS
mgnify:CR=1 FL=1